MSYNYDPKRPSPPWSGTNAFNQFGRNAHGEFNLQTGEFIPWKDDKEHDSLSCGGEDHVMWPKQKGPKGEDYA